MTDPSLKDFFYSSLPDQSGNLSPEQLTAMGPTLGTRGITLAPNAAGVNGKIRLPDGRVIDVIQGAGSGLNKAQWLEPASGGAAGHGLLQALMQAHHQDPTPYASNLPDSRHQMVNLQQGGAQAYSQHSPFTQQPAAAAAPPQQQLQGAPMQAQPAAAPAPQAAGGNTAMQQALGGIASLPPNLGYNPNFGNDAVDAFLKRKQQMPPRDLGGMEMPPQSAGGYNPQQPPGWNPGGGFNPMSQQMALQSALRPNGR